MNENEIKELFKDKPYLENGKLVKYSKHSALFNFNKRIGIEAVFFIIKGKVRLNIRKKEGQYLTIEFNENEVIGIPEVYAKIDKRVTEAICDCDCILYIWDETNFLLTSLMHHELSRKSIKTLSKMLRILNIEFLGNLTFEL